MKEWLDTKATIKKWETGWSLVNSNTLDNIFSVEGTRLTTTSPFSFAGTTDETIISLELNQSCFDPKITVKKVVLVDTSGCEYKTNLIESAPVAYNAKTGENLTWYAVNPAGELPEGKYNIFVKVKQKSKFDNSGE